MKCRKCPCPFGMDRTWVLFLFDFCLLFSPFCLGIKMKNIKAMEPAEATSEGAGAVIASTPPSPRWQWNRSGCNKCLARDSVFVFAHSPGFDVFIGSRCSAHTSGMAARAWASSQCRLLTLLTDSTTWLVLVTMAATGESVPSDREGNNGQFCHFKRQKIENRK
jgi:hypothetical protein